MNYFAPFSLSIFIHFGLVLSFSNFFNIDFNNFNIEASKPIETYLIFEEEKNFPKKKQYIETKKLTKKNTLQEPEKILLSDVNREIAELNQKDINNISFRNNNREISKSDLIRYSSLIKNQVMENWKSPSNINPNLKTEIEITIVPTGEITSSTIIQSSGNNAFDESAMRAISKVQSFEGLNMQMNLFDEHFRNFILIFSPD